MKCPFCFWRARKQRTHRLALEVEEKARHLRSLSSRNAKTGSADTDTLLRSASSLLELFIAEQNQVLQLISRAESLLSRLDGYSDSPAELTTSAPRVALEELCGFLEQLAAGPTDLSPAVQQVILLRDWVLLAKTSGAEAFPLEVFEDLYRQLNGVLAKHGVTSLEADGPFDENYQQVINLEPTTDPAKHHQISATLRPGYLFHGKLIRPQEVTLYALDKSLTAPS